MNLVAATVVPYKIIITQKVENVKRDGKYFLYFFGVSRYEPMYQQCEHGDGNEYRQQEYTA